MSTPENSPPPAPDYTGGQLAMILVGVIFLLPGACSLFLVVGALLQWLSNGRTDPFLGALVVLWMVCFAVSAVGVFMIKTARKRARKPQ